MARLSKTRDVSPSAGDSTLSTFKRRFAAHPHRHPGLIWEDIEERLNAKVLTKLAAMEESGGEPDVALVEGSGGVTFVDCAA